MSFLWPTMLIALLFAPMCAALYIRAQLRPNRSAQSLSPGGLQRALAAGPGARRHVPPILFLLGLIVLLLSLARPVAAISLPRLEGTVMLVFDVSGSMAATDLEPNRLAVAQETALAFVDRQPPTVQIGVVAFSDGGLAVQLPTSDRAAILEAIERLRPERGTSLGDGLQVALNVITGGAPTADATLPEPAAPPAQERAGVIVLLSDGENNARPDPRTIAQAAGLAGVPIFPVGIGTSAGAVLELDGFSVLSRLEAAALQEIAQISAGVYYSVEERAAIEQVYDEVRTQLVVASEETELTALFVGLAIVLLLAGGLYSLFWFSRLP